MSEAFDPRPVLLVHGLWNARLWLTPLAWRLRRAGFEVGGFGYPSIVGGAEAAVEALVDHLRPGPELDLVGHSLGGLIALEALRRAPDLPVRRVVCMGPPRRGSKVAQNLGRHWPVAWALGLADHCLVAASHTGLVFSRQAAAQAVAFLEQGRFGPGQGAEPL